MKSYEVVYASRALRQLAELEDDITKTSTLTRARVFVDVILSDCASLAWAPRRGATYQEAGREFRSIGIAKGRASVIFSVVKQVVTIQSIRYYGREF